MATVTNDARVRLSMRVYDVPLGPFIHTLALGCPPVLCTGGAYIVHPRGHNPGGRFAGADHDDDARPCFLRRLVTDTSKEGSEGGGCRAHPRPHPPTSHARP